MLLQEPVAEEEPETPPVPEAPPGPDLGPGVPGGNGPATGNGGGGNGRIGSSNRASASRYGWYAAQVQRSIREALLNDPRTRSQSMNLRVRVWADAQGRILRASLSPSSGNPSLDAHLKNQLLPGLKLSPPPPDMPMPIHLKISSSLPSR
jgi:membrane protein involved in colicin uptake